MERLETFYVIWNFAQQPPTKKHPTLAEAEAEATRLAAQNPGKYFTVLKAVSYFSVLPNVTRNEFAEAQP